MISFLEGKLIESLPTQVLLDVNCVGYEVFIPLSTFEKLPPPGSKVKLLTYFQIRQDGHSLFGFLTKEERDLFKLLVAHVSGIGPKLALNILGGCTPQQLRAAVVRNDVAFLARIKGMGKKTAERIVVELRDKVGVSQAWAAAAAAPSSVDQQRQNDAFLALISLDYKQADVLKALKDIDPNLSAEEMVREALKRI